MRTVTAVSHTEFPPGHEEMSAAVHKDAYDFLLGNSPGYLHAIEVAVNKGATPEEIQAYISRLVGPDRQAIAVRCRQAAEHIRRRQTDDWGGTEQAKFNITSGGVVER